LPFHAMPRYAILFYSIPFHSSNQHPKTSYTHAPACPACSPPAVNTSLEDSYLVTELKEQLVGS